MNTKLHAVSDAEGSPIQFVVTTGEVATTRVRQRHHLGIHASETKPDRLGPAPDMQIVRLDGPDQLLRSIGKISIAELAARVAAIRAVVEGSG